MNKKEKTEALNLAYLLLGIFAGVFGGLFSSFVVAGTNFPQISYFILAVAFAIMFFLTVIPLIKRMEKLS